MSKAASPGCGILPCFSSGLEYFLSVVDTLRKVVVDVVDEFDFGCAIVVLRVEGFKVVPNLILCAGQAAGGSGVVFVDDEFPTSGPSTRNNGERVFLSIAITQIFSKSNFIYLIVNKVVSIHFNGGGRYSL